ncbi:albumin 2 [Amia ocellicauda]|uniref:albumin 2 n=1 Tax=Amia ocellicauda TaxID=2972642 RepID=UPI0034645E3A
MKWVTLISLVIFISFPQTSANRVCEFVSAVKEQGFKAIVLVGLAQNLPKSTYEELRPLLIQSAIVAQSCCGAEPSADCSREEADLFQSAICASHEITEKNGLDDCCKLHGTQRTHCFVDHKHKIPHDASLKPDIPESEKCADYEKDSSTFMGHFIYDFARRHVLLQPQVILGIAQGYEKIIKECCKDAKGVHTCFDDKKAGFKHAIENRVSELKSTCVIYHTFGKRILMAKKLVQYSQKMPQATFAEVKAITERIANVTATCCSGDMIQCMKERKHMIDEYCANHEVLARTKHFAECCKASIIERGACIEKMKADDKPEGLSPKVEGFIKDKDVCQKYAEARDLYIGKFLYEYSRRHPELSIQIILRITKNYEEVLEKCCKTDDPPTCYGSADAQLAKAIETELLHFKNMCAFETTKGEEAFEKQMIVQYTRIMPQAGFEGVEYVAHKIADVMDHCCREKDLDHHLLPCAEEKLTNAIDQTCVDYDPATINAHIAHCCNKSYSMRRPCLREIKPDTEFVPPAVSEDLFPMGPGLCHGTPKDLFKSAKRLLYTVVRLKTTIPAEKLQKIITSFHDLKTKCCAEADIAACFAAGRKQLVIDSQALVA